VEDARDEYLRLLEPSGQAVQALSALLEDPNSDIEAARRAVGDYAAATEQFGNALSEPTWPQQVAQPISELSAQLLAQGGPIKAAAQGATLEKIQGLLGQVPAASAAERVRDAFEAAGA
jgi:hypothetical protein